MGGIVSSLFGGGGSSDGGAIEASNIQAQAQREALEYLKETNALPQQVRESALTQLDQFYGSPGGQQEYIDQVKAGGLYGSMMQGQEEAALRANAATGGLRGGQSISDVGTVQNQVLNQALGTQLGGLSQLAGTQTNQNQIAGLMQGIGQTQAMGITGAAQNQASQSQAGFGNMLGLGNLGLGGYMAYTGFSDIRLKDDIVKTGEQNGIPTYKWKWNKIAEKLGLSGSGYGTLSKVVRQIKPEAVTSKDGYDQVNYSMIGVDHG